MWSNLPFDFLANIFSLLSPDSLACARSTCRHWHACAATYPFNSLSPQRHPPWFLALPSRSHALFSYLHNPVTDSWHQLSLDFLREPTRLVSSLGSLILLRCTNSTVMRLIICNPFTRQHKYLPLLNISRTNPAIGVVILDEQIPRFRIYVAGGMSSETASGGTKYEPTMEMYDSKQDEWATGYPMPMEFAVRITVWTPNESVYCNGVLYWMTSARAYSVMGVEIESNSWREFGVPMAEKLEFAALTRRKERLTVVGGTWGERCCVWELDEFEKWVMISKVPVELGMKFLEGKKSWSSSKCESGEGRICLYREVGSGIVVWREEEEEEEEEKRKWEWSWVDGCCAVKGRRVSNLGIKGVMLRPNLAPSSIF